MFLELCMECPRLLDVFRPDHRRAVEFVRTDCDRVRDFDVLGRSFGSRAEGAALDARTAGNPLRRDGEGDPGARSSYLCPLRASS